MSGLHESLSTAVRRRRRTLKGRLLSIGAGLVVAAVAAGLLLALVAWPYAALTLEGVELEALASREHPPAEDAPPVAADTRTTLLVHRSGEAPVPGAVGLLQTTSARERPLVVSFPMDLKVQPPGRPPMRLAEVHAVGGPELLIATVEEYVGLDVDHYLELDPATAASGLARALGGVSVCLEEPTPAGAPLRLPAGCHRLSPAEAVRFVARGSGPAADAGAHLVRQHRLFGGALDEAASLRSVLAPWRLKEVIDVASDAVLVTDRDPGLGAMWRLASGLGDRTPEIRAVPGSLDQETGFVHALPEQAEALFQALRRASPVGAYDAPSARPRRPQVVVTVLNGAGMQGLAAEVAELLTSKGYRIATVDNAPRFDREASTVRYAPGREEEARMVARDLGGVAVEPLGRAAADDAHVVVVLGPEAEGRSARSPGPREPAR